MYVCVLTCLHVGNYVVVVCQWRITLQLLLFFNYPFSSGNIPKAGHLSPCCIWPVIIFSTEHTHVHTHTHARTHLKNKLDNVLSRRYKGGSIILKKEFEFLCCDFGVMESNCHIPPGAHTIAETGSPWQVAPALP